MRTNDNGIKDIKNELTTFQYNAVTLKEACWLDGNPYFTRKAIGEWLEYVYPEQSITKIMERNSHIRQFSVVVNLTTTDGKAYNTEVCDPIGFQLIVNKSNQPKAVSFQIEVARMVIAYMKGELKPNTVTPPCYNEQQATAWMGTLLQSIVNELAEIKNELSNLKSADSNNPINIQITNSRSNTPNIKYLKSIRGRIPFHPGAERFFNEKCVFGGRYKIPTDDLYNKYLKWAHTRCYPHPLGKVVFYRYLLLKFSSVRKTRVFYKAGRRRYCFTGIKSNG